jgi:hypothetical protein
MLSFRNLTLLLIVLLCSALNEVSAQTTLTLSGEIMNSTNDVGTSALGGASLHPTATFGVDRNSSIRFADPLNKGIAWWGGRVTANSLGSRTQINNRGVHSMTQSTPFFEGTGVETSGSGNFIFVSGGLLPDTPAGQLRFRMIDLGHSVVRLPSTAASDRLIQGRMNASGVLNYTTRQKLVRVVPPQYFREKGFLVVQIRYGCDGVIDPGQSTLKAGRQLDLDVLCSPFVATNNTTRFGGPYRDGRYTVRIKSKGAPKIAPLGTNWQSEQHTPVSTLWVDNLDLPGSGYSRDIHWNSGTILPGSVRRIFNGWNTEEVRIPVVLQGATTIEVNGMVQNSHETLRVGVGTVSISAGPAIAPGNPNIGNGVEVRVFLQDMLPF